MSPPRRPYDSPLRRQQAAATRVRIVAAGSDLVHELPSWDWDDLTFRAVADRAGVGLRTVYRYFPTERHLHDAVMERLEEEAGVRYEGMTLDSISAVAASVFRSMAHFAAAPVVVVPDEPTFAAEDDKRRRALADAVLSATSGWSADQREMATAALDVVWAPPNYERLVSAWGMDQENATDLMAWLIDVVAGAIQAGSRPPVNGRR
jgi:AcrR family transcriptional regulator